MAKVFQNRQESPWDIRCLFSLTQLTAPGSPRVEQGKTKVLCDSLGLEEGQIGLVCLYCERFEPRSHFKRLSLIVRVNVVLNRTVVVDSD